MDIETTANAIADQIRDYATTDSLNVYPLPVNDMRAPFVFIEFDACTYHETMGDNALTGADWTIWIGQTARPEDAYALIYQLMSDGGIVDALESDATLGGVVEGSWVESGDRIGFGEENAQRFAGRVTFHTYERRNA